MSLHGKSVLSWHYRSSDRSFIVDPLSYFSLQPVIHDWYNKGHGMCYPVCGMVYIKDPLLLIKKSSLCSGSSVFPLSLSEWLFTICPRPYNHVKMCCASLYKTFLLLSLKIETQPIHRVNKLLQNKCTRICEKTLNNASLGIGHFTPKYHMLCNFYSNFNRIHNIP